MSRLFARVKTVTRIPLEGLAPDLTWIEVREEISIGEERKIFAGAIKGQTLLKDGETRTEYDASAISFGQVVAYLSDWDAKDEQGKSVDVNPDTIRGLLPEAFNVIDDAVKAHIESTREKKPTPAPKVTAARISRAVAG
jgi:hypothetical protein